MTEDNQEKSAAQTLGTPPTEEWLRRHADAEDGKCISVGGLAMRAGVGIELVGIQTDIGDVRNAYLKGFNTGWELGMAEGFRRAALHLRAVSYAEYLAEVEKALDAERGLIV